MILIVGATGDLGGRVLARLVAAGEQVACLVRPGTDSSRLRDLGVTVVPGDLTDASTLPTACAGADVVVATATAIARRLDGSGGPSIREVDEDGMAALVGAAEAAGVARFVYVSFAGAEGALGSPLDRAKQATERRLAASSMRSVVVRPDAFQEIHLAPVARFDIAAGRVAVIGRGDSRRRWVATDDVAALVAAVAVEADPPAVVEFGGPEALSKNEAVAVAEEALGAPLKVQRMPRLLARAGLRLLPRRADALASVFGAGLLQDLTAAHWDDEPLRSRGIAGRPASEFLREQARAAAARR